MTIDVGRIKIVWQGTYNSSVQYLKDDAVYDGSSSSFICLATTTGNLPVSGSPYWDVLALGGALLGLHGFGSPLSSLGVTGSTYVDDNDGSLYWKTLSGWKP